MALSKIKITIFDTAGNAVKTFTRMKPEETVWRYEMLGGIKFLDLTRELAIFYLSDLIIEKQTHLLCCSYFKFGEYQQEKAEFIVEFKKLTM